MNTTTYFINLCKFGGIRCELRIKHYYFHSMDFSLIGVVDTRNRGDYPRGNPKPRRVRGVGRARSSWQSVRGALRERQESAFQRRYIAMQSFEF